MCYKFIQMDSTAVAGAGAQWFIYDCLYIRLRSRAQARRYCLAISASIAWNSGRSRGHNLFRSVDSQNNYSMNAIFAGSRHIINRSRGVDQSRGASSAAVAA